MMIRNASEDPHAHECYSCEHGSQPPAFCKPCRGCINRDRRPHWAPKAAYLSAAIATIAKASQRATKDEQP